MNISYDSINVDRSQGNKLRLSESDINHICAMYGVYGIQRNEDKLSEVFPDYLGKSAWKETGRLYASDEDGNSNLVTLNADGDVLGRKSFLSVRGVRTGTWRWNGMSSVSCSPTHAAGIKKGGGAIVTGELVFGKVLSYPLLWKQVVEIAAGNDLTVALTADGMVKTKDPYGNFSYYHDVLRWRDIVKIVCDNHLVIGLKSDGTVVSNAKHKGVMGIEVAEGWHDIIDIAVTWGISKVLLIGLTRDGSILYSVYQKVAEHFSYKEWALKKDCIFSGKKPLHDAIAKKTSQTCSDPLPVADNMEISSDGVLKKYTGQEAVVTVPEGVVKIGLCAFYSNGAIKEVILPKTLKQIDSSAFERSSLEGITIPPGVTKIKRCAFQYCDKLNYVALPDILESIGMGAFRGCDHLEELKLPSSLKSVEGEAFEHSAIKEIDIPHGMRAIRNGAFQYMVKLEKIHFPDTLKMIGDRAFEHCYNLREVRFPEGLLEIGNNAFDACTRLEQINFPKSLVFLHGNAFSRTIVNKTDSFQSAAMNVNAIKQFPKPTGYGEMRLENLKFYYASKESLQIRSKQREDILKQYGLCLQRVLTDSRSVYRDSKGQDVLMIYEPVPTFDFSDREWDSYKELFLIPDKGKMKGLMIRGGYRVANVLAYADVRCADSRTEKMLKGSLLNE